MFAAAVRASSSSAISRFSSSGTAEPSHMCDWNSGAPPFLTRSAEMASSGRTKPSSFVLRAVVGVQRDVDRVVLGDLVGVRGERDRAGDHVLDGRAGHVLGAAGGDLDDAVAAGLGEALQGGVQGLRRGDVDRRVGERALPSPGRASRRRPRGWRWAWRHSFCAGTEPPAPGRQGSSLQQSDRGAEGVCDRRTTARVVAVDSGVQFSSAARSTPKRPPEYARAVLSRVAG